HGRSIARHRPPRQGVADGACGRGGRSGRTADRSASRAGNRALRWRAVLVSGSVSRVDGSVENHRPGRRALDRVMGKKATDFTDYTDFEPRFVTVYGAGLIGSSFALALKRHNP